MWVSARMLYMKERFLARFEVLESEYAYRIHNQSYFFAKYILKIAIII